MRQVTLAIVGDCRIEVGEIDLTPSATHLFALALYISLENSRWIGRQELQNILFLPSTSPSVASHRLRQLLYRLRAKGLLFDERPSALRLNLSQIARPLAPIQNLTATERSNISLSALRILPAYAPRLSQEFAEWLDGARALLERELTTLLLNDIAQLRAVHAWSDLSKASATLRQLDPFNIAVVLAQAESLAMIGQRDAALQEIDSFHKDALESSSESQELVRLKARLLKTRHAPRRTPLVGRSDCLALLESQWTHAAENGARLFTLVGPAGIGKTRLADDFVASTSLGAVNVLQYRCGGDGRHYPLSLFSHLLPELRLLRGSLGISPEHHKLLNRLRLPLRSSRAEVPHGISKEAIRADLVGALVDLLEATSSERRLLLVVDDAHLLDNASVAVLRQLSSSSNRASLLVLACCRPGDGTASLLQPGERTCSFALRALSDVDAKVLLMLISGERQMSDSHAEWCVSQAAGNPFYLRALAGHNAHNISGGPVPFDITALAEGSYLSLTSTERLVLECCLFLGQHGTLGRIASATSLDDIALSTALRRLEELDLVRLIGATVRGPHALLVESLDALIPSTVSPLVHKRVAEVLAHECAVSDHSPSLALAAAQNYLAAGDIGAAQVLIKRCAHEAALVGEPGAAAELLTQLLGATLPMQSRKTLLDSLIKYSAESGARKTAVKALQERLAIGQASGEKPSALLRLELELQEARLLDGGSFTSAIQPLKEVIKHPESDRGVRLQGLVNLLIIADAEYDRVLADSLFAIMVEEELASDLSNPDALRAQLIYHTTFGQVDIAESIAHRLLQRFHTPSIDETCRTARRFASYALYRMLSNREARVALQDDYEFMASHAIRSEALYSSSLLTEIAINEGDFSDARAWFAETEIHLRGASAHKLAPNSGYYSSAAILAMMNGRYREAELLISAPQAEDARMHTARYEALCLALAVRLHMMRGNDELCHKPIDRLKELFERGCSLGGQDSIVEQLWCFDILSKGECFASEALDTYLLTHRRESGPCEWFFRHTTAADCAWDRQCLGLKQQLT